MNTKLSTSTKLKLGSIALSLAIPFQTANAVVLVQEDFSSNDLTANSGMGFAGAFLPNSLNPADAFDADVSITDGVFTTTGTSFTFRNLASDLDTFATNAGVSTLFLSVDLGVLDGGTGFAGVSLFTDNSAIAANSVEHLLIGRLTGQQNHSLSSPAGGALGPVTAVGEDLSTLVVQLDLATDTATLFGTGSVEQIDLNTDQIHVLTAGGGLDLGSVDQIRLASAGNMGGREINVDNFIIGTTAESVGAIGLIPEPSSTLLLGLGSLGLILRRRRS